MQHSRFIHLLEPIEQRWIALELLKFEQFVYILKVLHKSENGKNLIGRRK
jgi:hypothetical protein